MHVDTSRLLPIAALAAPLVIVQGARLFLGGGLAEAPASEVRVAEVGSEEAEARPRTKLTEEERELVGWMGAQREGLGGVRSPLDHPEIESPAEEGPAESVAPSLPSLPPMRVTGVVGWDERGFASINGEVYRVGDSVAPGWTLVSVDAREQRIELRSKEGRRVELAPERP